MTFSTSVPNASQSPGLFPAQNNTNFNRLKTIINADHNFTDSASGSQGFHRQASFINKTAPTVPVGLGSANGILYALNDSASESQLWWLSNATRKQITGAFAVLARGSQLIETTSTTTIYTVPDNSFGLIYMWPTNNAASPSQAYWMSFGGTVTCLQVPAYVANTTATTVVPIFYVNSGLELKPKAFSTFNNTYNYRIYQVS